MSRLARAAAPVEVAAVIAGVALGGSWGVIAMIALLSVALAMRGGRWFAPDGDQTGAAALGGALAGLIGLGGALAVAPALLAATGLAVEWNTVPAVRGSLVQLVVAALPTLALALAAELVFRRWLLERVAAAVRAAGEPSFLASAAGVVTAALVEAAVISVGEAGGAGRLGTMLASCGLGLLYVAAGGRLAASLSARLAFELGVLVLQMLRLVG